MPVFGDHDGPRPAVEHMSVNKLASVVVTGGLIWDTVKIETSGGANALVLRGYSKLNSAKLRNAIQQLIDAT